MDTPCLIVAIGSQDAGLPAAQGNTLSAAHNVPTEVMATDQTSTAAETRLSDAEEGPVAEEIINAWVEDNVEDTFEQLGVGSVRLKILWESELKSFTHKVEEENNLPAQVRRTALCFAGALLERCGAQIPRDWFKVMTLLDSLAVRATIAINDLPVMCAALVSIVRKTDTSEFTSWLTHIALHANELAHSLHFSNAAVSDLVSVTSIRHQEQQVIGGLDWHIEPASCETWISAFSSRLYVVSEGFLHPSIDWVRKHSFNLAHRICMWQSASKTAMPCRLALGVFCISSAMANLIACRLLCPDRVELDNWLEVFGDVPLTTPANMLVCDQCVVMLCIATGTHLKALQEGTRTVLTLIKRMKQEP